MRMRVYFSIYYHKSNLIKKFIKKGKILLIFQIKPSIFGGSGSTGICCSAFGRMQLKERFNTAINGWITVEN